jgi:hypothetical protein
VSDGRHQMSVANTRPQNDTPLPRVAAHASRQALAATHPYPFTHARTAARLLLAVAIMVGFAGLFAALIAHTLLHERAETVWRTRSLNFEPAGEHRKSASPGVTCLRP